MATNDNNDNNNNNDSSERPKDKFAKASVLSPRGVPSNQRVLKPGMDGYNPPDFIKRAFFTTKDGIDVNYYKAESSNEKAIVIGCTGLKSDYILEPEDLTYFNDHGISVVWISLPNPKRSSRFLKYYTNVAQQLTLDPPRDIRDILLKQQNGKPIPKIFMGHSTGAQLFLHLLEDHICRPKLEKNFCGAILNSTYLSPSTWPIPTRTFFHYCQQNRNKLPSELRISRWVFKNTDIDLEHGPHQKYLLPTFGQMHELGMTGQEIIDNVNNDNTNLTSLSFPVLSIVGENDWVSCPSTNKDISQKCGFAFANSSKAGHDPIYESKKMRKLCKNAILEMAEETFPDFAKRRKLFAYELNTGVLNSLTSFFQKRFGNGVRDPKVGG